MGLEELEQFDLLEQKIEALISLVSALREQRASLERKIKSQEESIASFVSEVELLKADRESVRRKIVTLLERIEACHV